MLLQLVAELYCTDCIVLLDCTADCIVVVDYIVAAVCTAAVERIAAVVCTEIAVDIAECNDVLVLRLVCRSLFAVRTEIAGGTKDVENNCAVQEKIDMVLRFRPMNAPLVDECAECMCVLAALLAVDPVEELDVPVWLPGEFVVPVSVIQVHCTRNVRPVLEQVVDDVVAAAVVAQCRQLVPVHRHLWLVRLSRF